MFLFLEISRPLTNLTLTLNQTQMPQTSQPKFNSLEDELFLVKQELADKNQVLQSVIEGTLAGYWDWDIPSNQEYLSPTFKKMFGYEDHEMENSPESWQRIMFPEDLGITFAAFEAHVASRGEIPFTCEVRYKHKNGSTVWVWCKGKVIKWDENGAPLRAVGSHVDITERKQFEIALRSSEERFRTAFANAGVGMALVSPEGLIMSSNPMLNTLFKIQDEGDKRAVCLFDFFTSESRASLEAAFFDVVNEEKSSFQEEKEFKDADGQLFWANFTISLAKDPNTGEALYAIIVLRDTTDKHEALESLERSNKDLEQFAYLTSHDLQEPLRTLIGFSEILQETLTGDLSEDEILEAKTHLGFINSAARRMSRQIQDILEYSKLGNKSVFEAVDLNHTVSEVMHDLSAITSKIKVAVSWDEMPLVQGSKSELHLLFLNLFSNALKFRNPNEMPKIHLACSENASFWNFTLTDNGIGIEEAYLERVFLIFQKLHSRSEFEGTGIGLAHCKKIIELHGGDIGVTSVFGEGSEFHFSISKNLK